MAVIVFPSENAVGTLFGSPTQIVREQSLALLVKAGSIGPLKCAVLSNFDVSAVPASNGVRIQFGSAEYAIINGILISGSGTETLTGLSDNTHFIYAQLTKVSSLVTTWSLVSNTTGTPPPDSVALARVVVAGGVAGTPVNAKKNPASCHGTWTGDGSGAQPVYLGFRPSRIDAYFNENSGRYYVTVHDPDFGMYGSQLFLLDASNPGAPTLSLLGTSGVLAITDWGFTAVPSVSGHDHYFHAFA